MMLRPRSLDELRAAVVAAPRVRVRGAGTKPALSTVSPGVTPLDLSALAGIVEHTPEECTFTALAGTRVAELEGVLAPHGQYLPFDPLLVDAGATIGGTVAAGVNGSRRFRYGGVRDFLIGARIVDGRGRIIRSGGKVVKNAAGFLLHQAMVGSCGRFGVLAEVTFKVFPRAQAYATVRVSAGDLAGALDIMGTIATGRVDLEALDLEAPATIWMRLGGFAEALDERLDALRRLTGVPCEIMHGTDDLEVWRAVRELAWAPAGATIVRVPLTPPVVGRLDAVLHRAGAVRRYTVAGSLALVAWPGDVDALGGELSALGLVGQMLIGPPGHAFIGAVRPNDFERRVKDVMDPDRRFSDD